MASGKVSRVTSTLTKDPGRSSPSGLAMTARAVSVRVPASRRGSTADTLPCRRARPPAENSTTVPGAIRSAKRSGTEKSNLRRSTAWRVAIRELALTKAPSLINRRPTTASNGARISVLAICARMTPTSASWTAISLTAES